MMSDAKKIQSILNLFCDEFECHTVLLYGSRARGDFTEVSDWDVIGFKSHGEMFRHTTIEDPSFMLDGFVHPEKEVVENEDAFLKILGAKILIEKDHFGSDLLKKIEARIKKGPTPRPAWEIKAGIHWVERMLMRLRREDLEGNLRRHWLLFSLLKDYFQLKNQWYLGPKLALEELKKQDEVVYNLFERALRPEGSVADIEKLVKHILNPTKTL
jgi:uncharacterized protein